MIAALIVKWLYNFALGYYFLSSNNLLLTYTLLAFDCQTIPYSKSDGQLYCAIALRRKLRYRDAIEVCKDKGARLPVIRTFEEHQEINQKRKDVSLI